MSRPLATVSVDVDPVDLHLIGYGHRDLPADPLVHDVALPRLLEVFARAGVRATFFVVGRDAAKHGRAVAALAAAGHEVASHSLTHPMAFARLAPERMRQELNESRRVLEQAGGAPVVGFRSPNFDMDARALDTLIECGYRYDASAYPTPLLLPARALLAWKSRSLAPLFGLTLAPFTWRRAPYRHAGARGTIEEYPVSVTPKTRFPVYHTARYLMSDARFERVLDGFVARGEPLHYPLHGVDVLGLEEDRVDRRLARHPGMELPLERKRALLEKSLVAITARFESVSYRQQLAPAQGAAA